MQTEKYIQLACDIAELYGAGFTHDNGRLEPYEPAEFEAGLTLAMAVFYIAEHSGQLDEVLKLHHASLEHFVAEALEKSKHRDDRLEISGFKL